MFTVIRRTSMKALAIRALSVLGLAATATSAQAISLQGTSVLTNGDCGGTSPSTFQTTVIGNASEFPDQDYLVDFGSGVTQWYDYHVFYVVDSANIVIGRYAQTFSTNTGAYNGAFFTINQRPTVTGIVSIKFQDEADGSPDQALGAVYVAGSTERASLSFDAVTLDTDCVPGAPADTTPPVITPPANQTVNTGAGSNTASLDVTSLGSVSDNVDSGLAITYKVGSTTLSGPYAFPIGVTTVTMDAVDSASNAATQ
ncbi:HYR domain-containing protein, partial [Celeribacter sp.]|uniref:HYR domain-containing protein n=1 Tax=Celeribacter sp. TaxID=1890673 RepID=UPI003A90F846